MDTWQPVMGMMMHRSWALLLLSRYEYDISTHEAHVLTSLVDVSKNLARVLLARPSMFMVPRKLVFRVLIGLYLHPLSLMPTMSKQC